MNETIRTRSLTDTGTLVALIVGTALVVSAPTRAPADQTKRVPVTTNKVAAGVANVPTFAAPLSTKLALHKDSLGYIGTWLRLDNGIVINNGISAPLPNYGWGQPVPCMLEVEFGPPLNQTFPSWKTGCGFPIVLMIPESVHADGVKVRARLRPYGVLKGSDWDETWVRLYKSPTTLSMESKSIPLPDEYKLVQATLAATEIKVKITKSAGIFPPTNLGIPLEANLPVVGRSVVVNVQGGSARAVPTSDSKGEITFQVLHPPNTKAVVQVAFMGDNALVPSGVTQSVPQN